MLEPSNRKCRGVQLAGLAVTVILAGSRPLFAAGQPYHFDYRVEGSVHRCLPALVFGGRHDVYLWMHRNPACRPLGATIEQDGQTRAVPVDRERPYWIVAARGPHLAIQLAGGRILIHRHGVERAGAHPLPHAHPACLTHPAVVSAGPRTRCNPLGARRGDGPARAEYHLIPGSARLQVMRWAERNHWHLGWHAPDWSVRQAIGLEAPLGVAVAALLRDARGATGRPYTLTVEPGARTLWVGLAKSRHGTDPRWVVSPGTLRMELGGWARQAGYQLIWHAPTDYRLTTHAVIRGRFVQAASILVRSLDQAGSALHLTVYRKNRVIVVSASA